jgi:N-acyl-D-aspartate/D-glutamate deacylase
MEEAIHKMTSMPAERMGIKNRGKIGVGMAADLLIFDPEEFTDHADYSNPRALATGMDTVILNGQIVYDKNTFYAKNGRVVDMRFSGN